MQKPGCVELKANDEEEAQKEVLVAEKTLSKKGYYTHLYVASVKYNHD